MRVPVSSANFQAPVYIDGGARNRVSVGESREHVAKKIEYDTDLGMCIIWPRRDKRVKTVIGKEGGSVGVIVARPDSFDVLAEDSSVFEKPATVKPGQKA